MLTYSDHKVTFTNPKLTNKVTSSKPKLTNIEPMITSSDPKALPLRAFDRGQG